jgi:hypothetical protein
LYNRYIPQSDGTYRRSRVEEPAPVRKSSKPEEKQKGSSSKQIQTLPHAKNAPIKNSTDLSSDKNPLGFLSHLFPKDFETSDLLVVLLLLLMSGENREDQNTALLTLILYLFL